LSLDSPLSELARICSRYGFFVLTTVRPTIHLLGVRARFNDPESGAKVYPKSCGSYHLGVRNGGGTCQTHVRYDERASDHRWAARIDPRAAPAVGWPLLLAMKLLCAW